MLIELSRELELYKGSWFVISTRFVFLEEQERVLKNILAMQLFHEKNSYEARRMDSSGSVNRVGAMNGRVSINFQAGYSYPSYHKGIQLPILS